MGVRLATNFGWVRSSRGVGPGHIVRASPKAPRGLQGAPLSAARSSQHADGAAPLLPLARGCLGGGHAVPPPLLDTGAAW
jgi:hypothetical protein